jgi:hypothetical protein
MFLVIEAAITGAEYTFDCAAAPSVNSKKAKTDNNTFFIVFSLAMAFMVNS